MTSRQAGLPVAPYYLTVSEACKYLRISRMTLLQAEERQLIHPTRTPGGHRRYKYDDLIRFMGEQNPSTENTPSASPALKLEPVRSATLVSLESALRQIILLLQAETGGAFLFDEGRRQLVLGYSFGIPHWLLRNRVEVSLKGVSGKVLADMLPAVFNSGESELPLSEGGRGQGLCVPLVNQREKLGTLQIFSTQRLNFFPSEINILSCFANLFSMLLVSRTCIEN